MRLAELEKACSESRYFLSVICISAYEAEARLNIGAAARRNFPAWDEAWEEMWKDAEQSHLSLRYILKVLMAANTLDNLPEGDREAVRHAWRNVEQAMGAGLDVEFIPRFRNREPIVSKSAEELRTITAAARDFAVALDRACGEVAASQTWRRRRGTIY